MCVGESVFDCTEQGGTFQHHKNVRMRGLCFKTYLVGKRPVNYSPEFVQGKFQVLMVEALVSGIVDSDLPFP